MAEEKSLLSDKRDRNLILKIREGDDRAMEKVLSKYKNLVTAKARRLFLQGGDQEDLIQEGMIGLYQAILLFDLNKNVPFARYASQVVNSRLYDAIRTAGRKKHDPLNQSLSLDFPMNQNSADGSPSLSEKIEGIDYPDPEHSLLHDERILDLSDFIEKELSNYEKKVTTLYLQGKKYNEIAESLGVSYKSVDGALQRVRRKITAFRESQEQ